MTKIANPGDCVCCGHPVGYHHAGETEQNLCTVKDCACTGYVAEAVRTEAKLRWFEVGVIVDGVEVQTVQAFAHDRYDAIGGTHDVMGEPGDPEVYDLIVRAMPEGWEPKSQAKD